MKKIILIIIFLITALTSNITKGTENTDEIIKEQEKDLGISSFIKDSQKYTEDAFDEIDVGTLYKDALSGEIKAEGIAKRNYQTPWKRSSKNYHKLRIYFNNYNNTQHNKKHKRRNGKRRYITNNILCPIHINSNINNDKLYRNYSIAKRHNK